MRGWNAEAAAGSLQRTVQDLVLREGLDGLWRRLESRRDVALSNAVRVTWARGAVRVDERAFHLHVAGADPLPLRAASLGLVGDDSPVAGLVSLVVGPASLAPLRGCIAVVEDGPALPEETALRLSSGGAIAMILICDRPREDEAAISKAERLVIDPAVGVTGEVVDSGYSDGEQVFIMATADGHKHIAQSAVVRYRDIRDSFPIFHVRKSRASQLKHAEAGQIRVSHKPLLYVDVGVQHDRFRASRIMIKLLALSTQRPVDVVYATFSFYDSDAVQNFPMSGRRHESRAKGKGFYWLSVAERKTAGGLFDYSAAGVTFEFLVPHEERQARLDEPLVPHEGRGAESGRGPPQPSGGFEEYLASTGMELQLWGRHQASFFTLGTAILPLSQLCRRGKDAVLFSGSLPLQPSAFVSKSCDSIGEKEDKLHVRAVNLGVRSPTPGASVKVAFSSSIQSESLPNESQAEELRQVPSKESTAASTMSADRFLSFLSIDDENTLVDLVKSEQVRTSCPFRVFLIKH